MHTIREKQKLLNRVRRIRGQIEAIERALDDELGCEKVMHLIAACRGAMNGLLAEVIEDHVRAHLVDRSPRGCALRDREKDPGALKEDAVDQLVEIVHTYFK